MSLMYICSWIFKLYQEGNLKIITWYLWYILQKKLQSQFYYAVPKIKKVKWAFSLAENIYETKVHLFNLMVLLQLKGCTTVFQKDLGFMSIDILLVRLERTRISKGNGCYIGILSSCQSLCIYVSGSVDGTMWENWQAIGSWHSLVYQVG